MEVNKTMIDPETHKLWQQAAAACPWCFKKVRFIPPRLVVFSYYTKTDKQNHVFIADGLYANELKRFLRYIIEHKYPPTDLMEIYQQHEDNSNGIIR